MQLSPSQATSSMTWLWATFTLKWMFTIPPTGSQKKVDNKDTDSLLWGPWVEGPLGTYEGCGGLGTQSGASVELPIALAQRGPFAHRLQV